MDALLALLTGDATIAMPPIPTWHVDAASVVDVLTRRGPRIAAITAFVEPPRTTPTTS